VYLKSSETVAFRLDEESPKGKRNKACRLPNSALFYSWEEEGEEMPPMVIKQTRRIRLKINRQVQPHTHASLQLLYKPKVPCTIADESSRFSQVTANALEKSTADYPVMAIGWTWITTGRHQLLCCANFGRANISQRRFSTNDRKD
jgi:hypothetical protein